MPFSAKMRAYSCQSIVIEMGGVSRYFSQASGSEIDLTLLRNVTQISRCWGVAPRIAA